jgi:hypothetical protein
MSKASSSSRRAVAELLAGYRRPGSPIFAHHYRRLPAKVLKLENGDALLDILKDEGLPARVREHAAGALGQIGFRKAIPALIDALGSPKTRRGAATALGCCGRRWRRATWHLRTDRWLHRCSTWRRGKLQT